MDGAAAAPGRTELSYFPVDPQNEEKLRQRVVTAAEQSLAHQQYVSAVEVLLRIGWLAPSHLAEWRQGRLPCLEAGIQTNLAKVSAAMGLFREWARGRGLQPSETAYKRATRLGKEDLRFSVSGDAAIEKAYRTHFISPALTEQRRAKLAAKSEEPDRVAFEILRDSSCSECGAAIFKGGLLWMEAGQPFCMACANLADLEYLERGDATLTRRAGKKSGKTVVVVRFSRSRGRYERQGILVEESALAAAEAECAADAAERAVLRARAAASRAKEDAALAVRMTVRIRELFPGCPADEAQHIAQWTAERGSGRVGRSEAGRALADAALITAVRASIRHRQTQYDELLAGGMDRELARAAVIDQVESIAARWQRKD